MTCDGMIRAEIWADINANTSNGDGRVLSGRVGASDEWREMDVKREA